MTDGRARLAVLAALGFIALVCLPPSGRAQSASIDLCLVCGYNGASSALLNIVLYLPLGAALWWRSRRLARVVAIGAVVSLSIELLQLFIPGRHTALSDLVANTVGAALGGLLAISPRAWILPQAGAARVAAAAATVAACAFMVLAGLLFRPSAPTGDYYGQWRPGGGTGQRHDGLVLDATLGDIPLPSSRLRDPERLRALLLSRTPVHVRFVAGSPTTRLTAVFRVVAGPFGAGDEVLQVGVDGTALVLTPRFRANDFRLARPEVLLEHALAGIAAGDTVALSLQARDDHGYEVTLNNGTPSLVGFSVGRSWSLLYATNLRSARVLQLMDLGWLFALATVVGWFAIRRWDPLVALAAFLAVSGTVPLWSYLLPTPAVAYVALAAGISVGHLLRRSTMQSHRRDGAHTS
jgi:hypothetical protein